MTDIDARVTELGLQGRCCTQIMVTLALEERGEENEQMAGAVGALCLGLFSGLGCGALAGRRAGHVAPGPQAGRRRDRHRAGRLVPRMAGDHGLRRHPRRRSLGAVLHVPLRSSPRPTPRLATCWRVMGCCPSEGARGGSEVTVTLCPVCLRRLDGRLERRGDEVWLERVCPDHGQAEGLVSGGERPTSTSGGGATGRPAVGRRRTRPAPRSAGSAPGTPAPRAACCSR